MVSAVLWDFGGVLTTSPFEAFARYEKAHQLPDQFLRTINSTNPDSNAWAKFERSEVSLEEFDQLFAGESAALGHRVPGREVIKLLAGDIRPNMVNALKKCAEKFNCTCLTNNVPAGKGPGMARDADMQAKVRDVMGIFHKVIESSKIGLRKPDPEIYRLACVEMGVEPQDVVYLDDLGVNLKPAGLMGMKTIKVVSEEQALADLSEAVGISF